MQQSEGAAKPMRVLVIGAHPDDCEFGCGGTAIKWAQQGHHVCLMSMTNGQSGHHEMGVSQLVARRTAEAAAAAAVAGVESRVLSLADGYLMPSLENRLLLIRELRAFRPDVVLTHRPNDYHPDHRYTSALVQDASFCLVVPHIAPETAALRRMPTILYLADRFRKPLPFSPDVAVDVDDAFATKVRMLHEHVSQMYEWLPWLAGDLDAVPAGPDDRLAWLEPRVRRRPGSRVTEPVREQLARRYGPDHAASVQHAEAFELCEYGHQPTADELAQIFHGI